MTPNIPFANKQKKLTGRKVKKGISDKALGSIVYKKPLQLSTKKNSELQKGVVAKI